VSVKRIHLPDFIELLVPTRDKSGKALAAAKQRHWKDRLARFLLEDLNVTGFQESRREGVWTQQRKEVREYDPEADRLLLVRETVHVMRTSCTRSQVAAFRRRGEALLVEMGRALGQEAVAYETRSGLVILIM
jgi:hypothetical protein